MGPYYQASSGSNASLIKTNRSAPAHSVIDMHLCRVGLAVIHDARVHLVILVHHFILRVVLRS